MYCLALSFFSSYTMMAMFSNNDGLFVCEPEPTEMVAPVSPPYDPSAMNNG